MFFYSMIPLNESIGVTPNHDQVAVNTSNGSPSSLSFAKVLLYLFMFSCIIFLIW